MTTSKGSGRVVLLLSVRPEYRDTANRAVDQSKFFERTVDCMLGLAEAKRKFEAKEIGQEEFSEDVEDLIDVWSAQFEESIPFVPSTQENGGA